jgi:hypothetical protein
MRRVQLNPYLEKTKLSEKMIEDDLKPSFNPKRGVRKETPNPIEEDFVCIFYGHAGHLDEFCFCRKRIKKRHFPRVCLVFLSEGLTPTLSSDTWTVHAFSVVVHIPLG